VLCLTVASSGASVVLCFVGLSLFLDLLEDFAFTDILNFLLVTDVTTGASEADVPEVFGAFVLLDELFLDDMTVTTSPFGDWELELAAAAPSEVLTLIESRAGRVGKFGPDLVGIGGKSGSIGKMLGSLVVVDADAIVGGFSGSGVDVLLAEVEVR